MVFGCKRGLRKSRRYSSARQENMWKTEQSISISSTYVLYRSDEDSWRVAVSVRRPPFGVYSGICCTFEHCTSQMITTRFFFYGQYVHWDDQHRFQWRHYRLCLSCWFPCFGRSRKKERTEVVKCKYKSLRKEPERRRKAYRGSKVLVSAWAAVELDRERYWKGLE